MTLFFIGLAALLAGLLFLNWFPNANPKTIVKSAAGSAIAIVLGVLLIVFLTKNMYMIGGLVLAALPWIQRLRMVQRFWKTLKGPSAGNTSSISCRFFDMTLDHDTGIMEGRIKEGRFAGALLSELNQAEGIDLHAAIQEAGDTRSLQLLESYLDRAYGAEWRSGAAAGGANQRSQKRPPGGAAIQTEAEALRILGLKRGATPDEITAAHHRKMKEVHPDLGGDEEMAAQVNAAKDFLFNKS